MRRKRSDINNTGRKMYGSAVTFGLLILILPVSGEETITCIPKQGQPIQSCHRFFLFCAPGYYIRFDTLQYHWSDCITTFNCPGPGHCCNIRNINYYCHSDFGMVDTYQAYEICSGREGCNGTALDVTTDVQEPTDCAGRPQGQPLVADPLSVSFEYSCIEASKVINLCEATSIAVNSSSPGEDIQLMYKRGSVALPKEPTLCSCKVDFDQIGTKKSLPTLAYQDIRLHREWNSEKGRSTCSSVHLSVSSSSKLEDRTCTSLEPVSSFYIRDPEPVGDDLVIKLDSLFSDGVDDEPEMIWLSLKVSSPVTVTCGSQIVPQKQTNSISDSEEADGSDVSDVIIIVVPVICVTIAVASIITVAVVIRKRRTKSTHSLQPRSSRSPVRTVGDCDIYETIDDLSRHGSRYSKTGGGSQGYVDAYSSVLVADIILRTPDKPVYDKSTTDDDYNRITLRTSREIIHDPDYARLHSDADSGVVDTFASLQTNGIEESDYVDNRETSVGKTTENLSDSDGDPTRPHVDQAEENVKVALRRKDSYEIPVIETKVNETVSCEYSKPLKFKREEKKQHEAEIVSTEQSDNYESLSNKENITEIRKNYEYEPIEVQNTCLENTDSTIQVTNDMNVSGEIILPRRSQTRDEEESDSDSD